ncbi:16S rRNA pseudouridine(516) synthase [Gammaproteobacteria bacterium 42_54_T18]|nr:16S rRNA pseudouridine(516) synthase [Gammaproteobacteria bacterium 42_54_T18]
MRLDKLLSNSTGISRSEIKKAIRQGDVSVDGVKVKNASMQLSSEQRVTLFGQEVSEAKPRYYMLNKPEGYVCANRDREHPTVLDLMIDEPLYEKLNIAGRLDIDTTGLVLLTDDGKWLHNVTSPKHHCHKRYIAQTAEPIENSSIDAFRTGIMLKDELKPTLPATLTPLKSPEESVNVAEIIISEGRYHQVKRMFGATNNRVIALHRAAIGDISLDDNLAPGEYRPLTQTEIDSIQ